jgi:hypothetical protein
MAPQLCIGPIDYANEPLKSLLNKAANGRVLRWMNERKGKPACKIGPRKGVAASAGPARTPHRDHALNSTFSGEVIFRWRA